ncbi:hypothetical protein [Chitinophaga solisilvae]|uniref:Uncharacterized protein n=1 Tax=Chitinophaga solisilvae TaxID=1233460 RepID=A0A433WCM1_9BACT|nr:hypothetical protein [Chitinophaga solisilvae]NSL90753.1 hypothetical protein [Chitinophaga solisilvae]
MKDTVEYHDMSLQAAAHFHIQPFLSDYVMVQTLFPLSSDTAVEYMQRGALRRLLINAKGNFQILRETSQLVIFFDDGDTLASTNSDMTWQEFFTGAAIEFNGVLLNRIRKQFYAWGLHR